MDQRSHIPLVPPVDLVACSDVRTGTDSRVVRLHVTVVDDNRDSADLLGMYFQVLGHTSSIYHMAVDALLAASHSPSDVYFIDIGMPYMNGFELVQKLRLLPQLQASSFIAFSGYSDSATRNLAREAGFHHFLTKPSSFDVFPALLNEHVRNLT